MNKYLVVLGVALVAAACRDNPVTSPAAERAVIATQRQHLVLPVTDNGDGTATVVFQPGPGRNNGTDQGTLYGGKDTDIEQYKDLVINYSGSPYIGHFNSDCSPSRHSFSLYQFDVTDLPDPSVVTSARLELYHMLFRGYHQMWPTATTNFSLYPVLTPWNETAVTWATQPALGAELIAVTLPTDTRTPLPPPYDDVGIAFRGWVPLDVTALYGSWKDGSLPNYGIAYKRTTQFCEAGTVATWTYTASSDIGDAMPGWLPTSAAWRPKLVVTYVTNHTPTVSIIPPFSAPVGAPVTFGANAFDEDGDALSYAWTIDGVAAGTTPTITYVFADAGQHVVGVTVSDGKVRGTASATAPYFVMTQAQWVDMMRRTLTLAGLDKGLTNSLVTKLDAATKSLASGNIAAAQGQLGAFKNDVEAALKTGRLPAALANQLLNMVNQLLGAL